MAARNKQLWLDLYCGDVYDRIRYEWVLNLGGRNGKRLCFSLAVSSTLRYEDWKWISKQPLESNVSLSGVAMVLAGRILRFE